MSTQTTPNTNIFTLLIGQVASNMNNQCPNIQHEKDRLNYYQHQSTQVKTWFL